jgi:hypothetical protein
MPTQRVLLVVATLRGAIHWWLLSDEGVLTDKKDKLKAAKENIVKT